MHLSTAVFLVFHEYDKVVLFRQNTSLLNGHFLTFSELERIPYQRFHSKRPDFLGNRKLYHRRFGLDSRNLSCPSSLRINSRLAPSFSFFPLLRFFPPLPLFFGISYTVGWLQPLSKIKMIFIIELEEYGILTEIYLS